MPLDTKSQNFRTTAVTETKEGIRVVSSSARRLTPAQRKGLKKNEVEGTGIGHADHYFSGLGVTGATKMRPVGNRKKK